MEIFQKMNEKMELGWKLSSGACEQCASILMYNPHNNTLNCIKCAAITPFEGPSDEDAEIAQQSSNLIKNIQTPQPPAGAAASAQKPQSHVVEEDEDDYYNSLYAHYSAKPTQDQLEKQRKSDEVSKKMGQKLLAGWAMLEAACPECLVPLMKPKQGPMLCVSCERQYIQPGQAASGGFSQTPPQEESKPKQPETTVKSQPPQKTDLNATIKSKIDEKKSQTTKTPAPKATPATKVDTVKKPEQKPVGIHEEPIIAQPPAIAQSNSSGDLGNLSKSIMGEILVFYQQRLRGAVARNDESEVSRIADKLDHLIGLVSRVQQL